MLMTNNNTKLLGLESVLVGKIEENPDKITIEISIARKAHECPSCGKSTDKVHDYREQRIRDLPIRNKSTYLLLKKRRYICKNCGKRFYPRLDFLPRYHQMTKRLYPAIISELRDSTSMKSVAKRYNISSDTVSRIFGLVSYKAEKLPEILAIDEFKGNAATGKYQAIITDPHNKKVLDICPTREKASLFSYFSSFDNRNDVHYFIMDMWEPYKDIAKIMFPQAKIIIDRYHYVRQVYWALENVRKRVQKSLNTEKRLYFKRSKRLLNAPEDKLSHDSKIALNIMLNKSDDLFVAWQLKELFAKFRHCDNSIDGEKLLREWILTAEESNLPEFKPAITAFQNWFYPILNSLDHPYTNGFTEGTNNKIKVLKRNVYGIRNFPRFRNRILHICA